MAGTDAAQAPIKRYGQLLDQAGVCPSSLYEYARPPAGTGGGVSLAACLDRPSVLATALRQKAGTIADFRDLRVHASVLQQDLALSIIGPLVTRLFLEGESYLPEPSQIRLVPGVESPQWHFDSQGPQASMEVFVSRTAGLVNAWYPVFRQEFGVSPGAYWSSVGLALCAPFSALWDKAPPEALCRQATGWLELFDCDAGEFIDWIPAEFNQQQCAIPQRRGCCLKFKLPEEGYCGTCGVYRKERMSDCRE
ncbi:(2Fe-2S)-binding protein [Marinobacter sp.]|uniref:(2Fe-2S)-binding protein n=1 Tax=Marinobacter sp. TaxID=50741 RepID=UPI003850A6D9